MKEKSIDKAIEQALRIMKILEHDCRAYNLAIGGVPVWWFARSDFFYQLVNALSEDNKAAQEYSAKLAHSQKSVSWLRVVNPRIMIVFLIRTLLGLWRWMLSKKRISVLFMSQPYRYRKLTDSLDDDVFFYRLYKHLSDHVIVETSTLTTIDAKTMCRRKDVIFLDWALAWGALHYYCGRREVLPIENWTVFTQACNGQDFDGISAEHLIELIQQDLALMRAMVLIKAKMADVVLNLLHPKAIVIACSYDTDSRSFILAAKKRHIPVFELQHGTISKYNVAQVYFLPENFSGWRLVPDRLLVFGDLYRETVLALENPFGPQQVVVTGFPRMTHFLGSYRQKRAEIRTAVRAKLGVSEDDFLVVITSHKSVSTGLASFLTQVLPLTDEHTFFCVKLHPLYESSQAYQGLLSHPRVQVLGDEDIDIYSLLTAVDVHSTIHSTVLVECLLLEIPNIVIRTREYYGDESYEDACIYVETPRLFATELSRLNHDPAYRNRIINRGREFGRRFYYTDTPAEELITREIRQLAGVE